MQDQEHNQCELLDFSGALAAMESGKSVRRDSCPGGPSVRIGIVSNEREFLLEIYTDHSTGLDYAELTAKDWRVCEDH